MIDFHSHILPYLDDGSKSLDMSIEMLKLSVDEGVEQICATPHFIMGEFEIEKDKYDEKFDNITNICKVNNIEIDILRGLELYIHPDLPKLYKEGLIWGINGSRYLLIELPMRQFPIYTEEVFYELRLLGAVPILAHPERNIRILNDESLLLNLIEQGVLAQITSGSLRGIYGKDIKNFSEKLVKKNMVHVVGSDAHNNSVRSTLIKKEYESIKMLNKDLYNWIIENETRIVNNEEVVVPEVLSRKKKNSFFKFFSR